jgi:hypothetical protein
VIAREYGFDNWANLKVHVGALSDDPMEALTAAIKAHDPPLLRQVLERYPALKAKLDEPLPDYSFDTPALIAGVHKENREMGAALPTLLLCAKRLRPRARALAHGVKALEESVFGPCTLGGEHGAPVQNHRVRLEIKSSQSPPTQFGQV